MEQRVSSSKSIKHAASLSPASYHKIVPNRTIPYIEFQHQTKTIRNSTDTIKDTPFENKTREKALSKSRDRWDCLLYNFQSANFQDCLLYNFQSAKFQYFKLIFVC